MNVTFRVRPNDVGGAVFKAGIWHRLFEIETVGICQHDMQIGCLRQRITPALNFHSHAVSFGQRHDLTQRCDAPADGGVHTYRTPAARTNGKADLLQIAYSDWNRERAEALARFFVHTGESNQIIDHGRVLPAQWDEIDWPAIASQTVGAARDSDYLNWRYLEHPSFKYGIVTVPDGARTGLAVWRLEPIQQETPVVSVRIG